jgi:CRP/FNR family transcriptional regulator, cyclic AMP receptor protein
MAEIDELRCCNVLGDLDDRELAEVAKLATVEKRGAGSRVIAEGTEAGALYLMTEGKAEVRMMSRDGHEVVIDQLGPGELFGWSAVLDHKTFKAAIWTLEDSKLVVMDGDQLRRLFEANNHIGYRVVRVIADMVASRMEKMRARLVDQPFSEQYLAPVRAPSVPVTGEKSEMRTMPCPECSTANTPLSVVNETEQYRCRNCGMVYYTPVGCETGSVTPGSGQESEPEVQLPDNWSASTPSGS